MTSLRDFDTDPVLPTDEAERERWRIDGDNTAAWAMRKAAALQARIDANTAIAEAEYERVQAWLAEVNRPIEHDLAFFTGHLENYARVQRLADPERKTFRYPHGCVVSRKPPPTVEVDEDVFVPWARGHAPELLKVDEVVKVKLATLKALQATDDGTVVTADGEPLPGVTSVQPEVTFVVKPDGAP